MSNERKHHAPLCVAISASNGKWNRVPSTQEEVQYFRPARFSPLRA